MAGASVSDQRYPTFTAACAAASQAENTDKTLLVTKAWPDIPSQMCVANLAFAPGGVLQVARHSELTVTGLLAAPIMRIFDISLQGSSVDFGSTVALPSVYPQWWGAIGDGAHDDTAAIQGALDAVKGNWTRHTYSALAPVLLIPGNYRITDQIRVYGTEHAGAEGYDSYVIRGCGRILRQLGSHISVRLIALQSDGSASQGNSQTSPLRTAAADGFQLSAMTGRKILESQLRAFSTTCLSTVMGGPGDGIDIGRSQYQADQLSIRDPFITHCTSGAAININDHNALSTNIYNASIGGCSIGIRGTAPGINIGVFGGEIDGNDVNFFPAAGEMWLVSSVGCRRFEAHALYGRRELLGNFTLLNYALSNIVFERPATVATATSGATDISLSVPGFTFGDAITIAGAGAAGADLHAYISSMTDPVTAVLAFTPVVTAVRNARVTLDAAALQNNLIENGRGPYVHLSNHFNPATGATTSASAAPQIFIGNGWTEHVVDPFGLGTVRGAFQSPVLIGNILNTNKT